MAKAYDKDFLVEVYMSRFVKCASISIETLCSLEKQANDLYDKVGKTTFRVYASVTPEAIKEFQNG
jgi:hypothetical protein